MTFEALWRVICLLHVASEKQRVLVTSTHLLVAVFIYMSFTAKILQVWCLREFQKFCEVKIIFVTT
jgi:hypothetical protein